MADLTVNGKVIMQGSLASNASLEAQPIGGGFIFQVPNAQPVLGQMMVVTNITGLTNNVVTLGWATPATASSFNLSQLTQSGATSGQVIEWNGSAWAPSTTVPGSGTVTSVALTVPSFLSVGGSPITGAGTFAVSLATQSANLVFAGPSTGSAAAPTFRALVAADIPALAFSTLSAGANPNALSVSGAGSITYNGGTAQAGGVNANYIANAQVTGTPATNKVLLYNGSWQPGFITTSNLGSTQGNGTAVQLTNNAVVVAGDVVTYDSNGNTQDSGTLLSSLAPKASPTFTGTVAIPTLNMIAAGGHVRPNPDLAGTVTLLASTTSIAYTFSTAYNSTPMVVVTPSGATWDTFAKFWVVSSTTGFTLNVDAAPAGSYTFNYMVMGL